MAAQFCQRVLISFIAFQAVGLLALDATTKLDSESGEVARAKPISATSTCGEFEKYCYSPGKSNIVCGLCSGDENIGNVNDGNSSGYWLSAVLPTTLHQEQVNITINLVQQFQIHEITVTTAFTSLPAVWLVEGSKDGGRHYKVLRYFVSETTQCALFFGLTGNKDIDLCVVQTPTLNGLSEKITVPFDNVVADRIRLKFISLARPKNVGQFEEFMRYYTLQEISVKGAPQPGRGISSKRVKRQACYCSNIGTSGFVCNPPRGQACPCRAKFGGRRCSKCARGLYNFPRCQACGCSSRGSINTWCKRTTGECRCIPLVEGRTCNKCSKGYAGFPSCNWCGCNMKHTTEQTCDDNGKCLCKVNYDGKSCGRCKLGYGNYPECKKLACFCTLTGSTSTKCDSKGLCGCKKGYRGAKCDQCSQGYFGYPNCQECACHSKGALFSECDSTSGRCVCYPHIAGRSCNRCIKGYFGFPRCRPCTCNPYGTQQNALSGNSDCASGKDKFQCKCKQNVGGAICDVCKDMHYLFSPVNPLGCKACGCFKAGTVGGLESCDENSGKCACKPFMEEGKCHECRRGYHSLKSLNTFGCSACKCNPGGARYGNCDKQNGRCVCRKNVGGFLCDRIISGPVYVPSLHHIMFEVEEARRLDKKRLRYEFDNNIFPSFSWKGYVPFSPEQSTVVLTMNVRQRSVYRIYFRCIFEPVGYPITTEASFTVSPTEGVLGFTRDVTMTIKQTHDGARKERSALLALSGDGVEEEFLMFRGKWTMTITCESKYLLMDYLVLMPEEYYDGTILQTERVDPCVVNDPKDKICDKYSYPDITHESVIKFEAENGFFTRKAWDDNEKLNVKYYRDNKILKQLGANGMVHLNKEQNRFSVEMDIPKKGFYVFVIHFFCPGETQEKIDVYVHRERGALHIVPCAYQFGCRQVVMKDVHVVKKFDIGKGKTPINLFTSEDANIAIDYIKAIPYDLWDPTYITPALECRSLNGKCISSQYEETAIFKRLAVKSRSTSNSFISSRHGTKVVKFLVFFNPKRENYQLVLQYQQTDHAIVDCDVVVVTYSHVSQGIVRLKYCPNKEFCRVLITPVRENEFNIPQGTTSIELRLPLKKDVKISWLYIVKARSYTSNMLSFAPVDNSKTFIEQCSRNSYTIDPKDQGYCRKSSFALTTHLNNGALSCRCNHYGAKSAYCQKTYGQCKCRRPNIIGRRCSQCASGYYGFPLCRPCMCDPNGAEGGTCDYLGRCICKSNYNGKNCNHCKPGFFGFPNCKACKCNVHGSLSTFCTSSGQCQCRRSFDGKTCDKCRIGFFGFPDCRECNCDASGIKPVEGLPSGCNSSNEVKCTCKENVQGGLCDTCKDYHYNLQFNNPKGCQNCSCDPLGTNGQQKSCDKTSGQCPCKSHVAGKNCAACKDGFTSLKDYSMFGCVGCACDYGGSWDNDCNKITGACSCLRNIGGKKCSRVRSRNFYTRHLHHVQAEFEDATFPNGQAVVVRHREKEFPGFSGRGYIKAIDQKQVSIDVIVSIPRPTKYRMLIRYILDSSISVYVQVTASQTKGVDPLPQGYKKEQIATSEFSSTATRSKTYAKFLTVKHNRRPAEFFLTRGRWRLTFYVYPSPDLFLDYVVIIPEDYYKATNLRKRVQNPCTLGPISPEFCVEYKYLEISGQNVNTIPAKSGERIGQRTTSFPYLPSNSVELNPQSQLTLALSIEKTDEYVILLTYYQKEESVSEIIVIMTSGFSDLTARVPTTQCKYSFGCRQVAIDADQKITLFTFFPNARNLLSFSPHTVVAVMSVVVIPHKLWNMEYLLPGEHCVKMNGKCVQTTYNIPRNAIRVDAEKRNTGMKMSFAMDKSVRAAYLAGDGVSLRIKSNIVSGRYRILVHYYQPSNSRHRGRIIVQSGRSTALSLQFKYCPNVGGCRALAQDSLTGYARALYIYNNVDVTISILAPNEVWIDYVLFVPTRLFKASQEYSEPVSLAKRFLKECSKNDYVVDSSSSEFCRQSVFAMTTRFNAGAAACDCNRRGAISPTCERFGGQCHCKENIVGRHCDKCKGGYTGFPNCRRG